MVHVDDEGDEDEDEDEDEVDIQEKEKLWQGWTPIGWESEFPLASK